MINLSSYGAIRSHLFVRIEVDHYVVTPGDDPVQQVLRFSDLRRVETVGGEEYVGVGNLMGITSSSSEIRASSGELTITLSGIPDTAIAEIVNSRIKGSPVSITRVLFDPLSTDPLNITGNPLSRFRGFVNNYSLQEDWDQDTRTSSNTISLICASSLDLLANKYAGRKTNPYHENRFFPNDRSMDRVPTLQNATFDFGKPTA